MRLLWLACCAGFFAISTSVFSSRASAQTSSDRIGFQAIDEISKHSEFKTPKGRSIVLQSLVVGAAESLTNLPRFYIEAGLHGDERTPVVFARWLARRISLKQSPLNLINDGHAIFDIVAVANPDGYADNERANSQKVNLNRNFPILWGVSREFPGSEAMSAPETKAIDWVLAQHTYVAAVDLHGYMPWIVMPSPPKALAESSYGEPNAAQQESYRKLRTLLLNLRNKWLPRYQVVSGFDLGDGGAFEDSAFWRHGTLAFCLEMLSPKRSMTGAEFGPSAHANDSSMIDLFVVYEEMLAEYFSGTLTNVSH